MQDREADRHLSNKGQDFVRVRHVVYCTPEKRVTRASSAARTRGVCSQLHCCCTYMVIRVSWLQRKAAPASMVMMRSKVGTSGRPWPASSGLCNVMLGFASAVSILPRSRTYHVSSISQCSGQADTQGGGLQAWASQTSLSAMVQCFCRLCILAQSRFAACLSCAAASDLAEMS